MKLLPTHLLTRSVRKEKHSSLKRSKTSGQFLEPFLDQFLGQFLEQLCEQFWDNFEDNIVKNVCVQDLWEKNEGIASMDSL